MAMFYQAYMKWFPIPLPPASTFEGQTAVVTGATGGMGLAAAAHLINLGASEVVISSRNPSRTQDALAKLASATDGRSHDRVRVLELDMERYDSIVKFADEVKKIRRDRGGVDVVILNAGVITADPESSGEGWDQNIQVNTISTTLLALLLLPHMKAERAHRATPAHLSIVGSMMFAAPKIDEWATWTGEGILRHLSKPENFPGGDAMYASTKLLLMYAFRELVELAKGDDGRPQVILNTMCPGIVKTDLSRNYKAKGVLFTVVVGLYVGLFGKSAANGARTYMAAVTTGESEHGKMIQFYKSEKQLEVLEQKVLTSEAGRRMQAQVWGEIKQELVVKVPETRQVLGVSLD